MLRILHCFFTHSSTFLFPSKFFATFSFSPIFSLKIKETEKITIVHIEETNNKSTKQIMKVATIFTCLSALCGVAFAGVEMEKNASTDEERATAMALIASGAAIAATVIGAPVGIPMMIADNEDGTSSCWLKVLNSNEISNPEDYRRYKKLGLPVDEFLKHASISVYPPGHRFKYVARNRRGEQFHMRQTMDEEDYKRFHMEKMPKLITWHPEEQNFE